MSVNEMLILFWVVPALVTFLVCLQMYRIEDNLSPDELRRMDWVGVVFFSVVYPVLWVWLFCEYGIPFLLKDRKPTKTKPVLTEGKTCHQTKPKSATKRPIASPQMGVNHGYQPDPTYGVPANPPRGEGSFSKGFFSPNEGMDGWYIWRNSPEWPIDDYRFVQVCDGVMRDEEPLDSHGSQWVIDECEPFGEFYGPLSFEEILN